MVLFSYHCFPMDNPINAEIVQLVLSLVQKVESSSSTVWNKSTQNLFNYCSDFLILKCIQESKNACIKKLPFFQEVSDLNDRELKALLDEAMNYKNPKDREGKSELFNVRNGISISEQVPKTLTFLGSTT